MNARPRILVLLGALWPGNGASGPNLSLTAMCEALQDEFEFLLVARDRPFGAAAALVGPGWHDLGFARVHYLPVGRFGAVGLGRLLDETPHDVLYLNGFNDREFTIPALVRRRLRGRGGSVLLSPRGEFSAGARALKPARKRAYLALVRAGGLLCGVTLHATSAAEFADMKAVFPRKDIRLIQNFRPLPPLPAFAPRGTGDPLRIAFVGRISPVKGTDFALRALALVQHPVAFEIYGPVQDMAYWQSCEALIAQLPGPVQVAARGEVSNAAVSALLARQDIMFLPSKSENFGHAIFEALAAGTPVLIGPDTPWRNLTAARAGFDLPLHDPGAFAAAIDSIAAMPLADYAGWRASARAMAEQFVKASSARQDMARLLGQLASAPTTGPSRKGTSSLSKPERSAS